MDSILRKYIETPFKYVFDQGPDKAPTFQTATKNGINCISLSHLVLKDLFGIKLAATYKSLELFMDTKYFENVSKIEDLKLGDLVWFGSSNPSVVLDDFEPNYLDGKLINWREFPVNHVAIYTGAKSNGYQMLHATPIEGSTVIWPLEKFKDYEKYQRIYGIKRLKSKYRKSVEQF